MHCEVIPSAVPQSRCEGEQGLTHIHVTSSYSHLVPRTRHSLTQNQGKGPRSWLALRFCLDIMVRNTRTTTSPSTNTPRAQKPTSGPPLAAATIGFFPSSSSTLFHYHTPRAIKLFKLFEARPSHVHGTGLIQHFTKHQSAKHHSGQSPVEWGSGLGA